MICVLIFISAVCPAGKEWNACAFKCSQVCHYFGKASGACSDDLTTDDCVPGCKSVTNEDPCPEGEKLSKQNTCMAEEMCSCLKPDGTAAKVS